MKNLKNKLFTLYIRILTVCNIIWGLGSSPSRYRMPLGLIENNIDRDK